MLYLSKGSLLALIAPSLQATNSHIPAGFAADQVGTLKDPTDLKILTAEQKYYWQKAHNIVRQKAAEGQYKHAATNTTAKAANIEELLWDEKLAKAAQDYANVCNFYHSPMPPPEDYTNYFNHSLHDAYYSGFFGDYGESLGITGKTGAQITWQEAIDAAVGGWESEHEWTDTINGNCDDNKMCGHYQQMVWHNTRRVGCGMAQCASAVGSSVCDGTDDCWLSVCMYWPPAKFGVGPGSTKAYKAILDDKEPGNECTSTDSVYTGLCENESICEGKDSWTVNTEGVLAYAPINRCANGGICQPKADALLLNTDTDVNEIVDFTCQCQNGHTGEWCGIAQCENLNCCELVEKAGVPSNQYLEENGGNVSPASVGENFIKSVIDQMKICVTHPVPSHPFVCDWKYDYRGFAWNGQNYIPVNALPKSQTALTAFTDSFTTPTAGAKTWYYQCTVPQCTCNGGKPLEAPYCKTNGDVKCQADSCERTHEYDATTQLCNAKDAECSCPNGVGVIGTNNDVGLTCPSWDAPLCVSCTGNYHLSDDKTQCVENECKCDNGNPVPNADCLQHNQQQCGTCSEFFHLVGNSCQANVCKCDNGVKIDDSQCKVHDGQQCASCTGNYKLSDISANPIQTCVGYQCNCLNGGVARAAGLCTADGANECESCVGNFHLNGDGTPGNQCVANECVCNLGDKVDDADCTSHNANQCKSCDPFYHVDLTSEVESGVSATYKHCVANVCTCNNAEGIAIGNAVANSACNNHNQNQCADCFANYKHDATAQTCSPYVCNCLNGNNYGPGLCSADGANECASCHDFFHLSGAVGSTCEANSCKCEFGNAVDNAVCVTHDQNQCKECTETNYYLDTSDAACKPNQCVCPGGTPVGLADCDTNGATRCQAGSCDTTLYTEEDDTTPGGLAFKKCVGFSCTCAFGNPRAPGVCSAANAAQCGSCDPFYHLADDTTNDDDAIKICSPNVCTCDNGKAVANDGTVCIENNSNQCASCNNFYHLEGTSCVANVCKCPGGTAIASEFCATHDSVVCASCKPTHNYNEQARLCVKKTCKCTNGVAATDDTCIDESVENCASCTSNFQHVDSETKVCANNICTCAGGTAVPPNQCSDHGAEKCYAAKTLKLSSGFTTETWNAAYENKESAEYKELEARLLAKILADLTAGGVYVKSGSIQILSVSASSAPVNPPAASSPAASPPAASPDRKKRSAGTQHTVVSYVIVAFYNPETTNEAALTSSVATASGATVEVTDNTCSCANGTAKTGADCDASKNSSNQCSACSEGYTLNTTTESCDKDVVAPPPAETPKPTTEERSEDDKDAEGKKETAGSAGSSLVMSLILIFVSILI